MPACILALFAASFVSASAATTWYVYGATTGTQVGTLANPFKTIAQGTAHAVAGDTIEVETGDYREPVRMTVPGVTMVNYPGQTPLIDGTGSLSNQAPTNQMWSTYPGTTYAPAGTVFTTSASWAVRDLYATWTKQPLARLPANNTPPAVISSYNPTTGIITIPTVGINITSANILSTFVYIYDTVAGQNGTYSEPVSSVSSSGTTTTIQLATPYPPSTNFTAGDTLLICNHPSLIRSLGDWAYSYTGTATPTTPTTIYYASGTTGNLGPLKSSQNYQSGVVIVSNCTIDGFEVAGFTGTGYGINAGNTTSTTIKNCLVHDNGIGNINSQIEGAGIVVSSSTNDVIENCEVFQNFNGVGTSGSGNTNVTIKYCDIAYNMADGIDLATDTGDVIENCWIHNHTALAHPDSIQSVTNDTNLTLKNCFNGMSVDGAALCLLGTSNSITNNVFYNSATELVRMENTTGTIAFGENTYLLAGSAIYLGSSTDSTGIYNNLNNVIYRSADTLGYMHSSDYNLLWNGSDIIAATQNPPDTAISVNATNLANLYSVYPQFELHSNPRTVGTGILTNVPRGAAVVSSDFIQSTNTVLVLDSNGGQSLAGLFAVNDVVEVDGDGVVRSITASSTTTHPGHTTITITPAMPGYVQRILNVWDWPAGTTNLVLDTTPVAGGPAASGSNTGGAVGSTINTVQYQAHSFDGTGTRSVPAVPSNEHYSSYWAYPYQGP